MAGKGRFNAARLDTRQSAEAGFELELRDLDGEKCGVFIRLIGADAEEYRAAERKLQISQTQEYAKSRNLGRAFGNTEEGQRELLVKATKGWRSVDAEGKSEPVVDLGDGVALPFNPDNVRKLYMIPAILEQVREAVNDRANFSPRPASSS